MRTTTTRGSVHCVSGGFDVYCPAVRTRAVCRCCAAAAVLLLLLYSYHTYRNSFRFICLLFFYFSYVLVVVISWLACCALVPDTLALDLPTRIAYTLIHPRFLVLYVSLQCDQSLYL